MFINNGGGGSGSLPTLEQNKVWIGNGDDEATAGSIVGSDGIAVTKSGDNLNAALNIGGISLSLDSSTVDSALDLLPILDANAGTVKKISPSNIVAGANGLQIYTTTFSTGNVGSGSSVTGNTAIAGSRIFIIGATVERTAGTSTSFKMASFSDDAFSDREIYFFGSGFDSVTLDINPFYGPWFKFSGGGWSYIAYQYYDLDDTDELHWEFFNEDFANDGTYSVTLYYTLLP